jgi:hypothetical protein
VVSSTNIAANGTATFFSGWVSTTCPTYKVSAHTYGNPSGLDMLSYPQTCSAV